MVPVEEGLRKSPAVTVIIPTHNDARYLRDAVDSVRAQTWDDWECIVVDDGSTDETPELLEGLAMEEPRLVRLWQSRRGPSAARNAGLRQARGELIQFLDADDLIGPTKLGGQVSVLQSDSSIDIVYGPTRSFAIGPRPWSSGRAWSRRPPFPAASGTGSEILDKVLEANMMVIQAPLVRRRLLRAVGPFDETLQRMEDWELWLRCALAGAKLSYAEAGGPEGMSYVRTHVGSLSHDGFAMLRAEQEIRERLPPMPTARLQRANRRRMADIRGRLGVQEGLYGDLLAGIRQCVNARRSGGPTKWLVVGCMLPVIRYPPGSWAFASTVARRAAQR